MFKAEIFTERNLYLQNHPNKITPGFPVSIVLLHFTLLLCRLFTMCYSSFGTSHNLTQTIPRNVCVTVFNNNTGSVPVVCGLNAVCLTLSKAKHVCTVFGKCTGF